jgi:hypothetical protein
MNRTTSIALALLSSLAATAAVAPDAHADLASDRVLLVEGSTFGCTGARGFYRIVEDPEGGSSYSTSTEFRVPAGYYLEIGSIEYTLPHYMKWATSYVQSLNLNLRRRSGTGSTSVFTARFQNHDTYAGGTTWDETNEYVSPGATTHVASFPHGPLMGNGARLCASAPSGFWNNGGFIRVRGRLVPTGSPVIAPIDPPTNSL